MLKKLLCIALVVAIVGSAVFFFVYDKVGRTYNYEKHAQENANTYLGIKFDAALIESFKEEANKLGMWKDLTKDAPEFGYMLAQKILSAHNASGAEKLYEGKLSVYDKLNFAYYVTTEIDGKEVKISNPTFMNLTSPQNVQIGADPETAELAGMLSEGLKDTTFAAYSFFTSGAVLKDDKIWVNVSWTPKDKSTTKYDYYETTLAGLDSIYQGLTTAFETKQNELIASTKKANSENNKTDLPPVIGSNLALKVGEQDITLKVYFAARQRVTSGAVVAGDTLYFNYKKDSATTSVPFVATMNEEGKAELKDAFKSDDFYTKLLALEIGKADQEIKLTVDGKEVKYTINLEYATPADPKLEREGLLKNEPLVIETKYPADSETVRYGENGERYLDADKKEVKLSSYEKVKVYIYMTSFNHVDHTEFDTIYTDLSYKNYADAETAAYLAAVVALRTEEDKGENANADTVKKLKDEVETARKAYNKANNKPETEPIDADKFIIEKYDEYVLEETNKAAKNELRYEKAEIVWDGIVAKVEEARKAQNKTSYPKRAVKLEVNGIVDELKATYYANKGKTGYTEKNFKTWLASQDDYKGDVDAKLEAEAQKAVLENMIVYALAEVYGTQATEDQKDSIDDDRELYKAYASQLGMSPQPDAHWQVMETAYVFDNTMQAIVESFDAGLKQDKD